MFYQNLQPVIGRDDSESADTADEAAFLALAGMTCSVCDRPLSAHERGARDNASRGFTCCGRAHCPYCGAAGSDKCRHLAGYESKNEWRVAGLPESLRFVTIPEPPPVSREYLLDYSEAQKQRAFGDAYPLFPYLYGDGWLKREHDAFSGKVILDTLLEPANCQYATGGRYYFDPNVPLLVARMERALFEYLPNGFAQLLAEPAADAAFVEGIIAAGDCLVIYTDTAVHGAAFSPDGSRLAIIGDCAGAIWRFDGSEGNAATLETSFACEDGRTDPLVNRDVLFSPDGERLLIRRARKARKGENVEVRCACTGALAGLVTAVGAAPAEGEGGGVAFLHDGASVAIARGRGVTVHPAADVTLGRASRERRFALRAPLTHFAAASGDRFATATGQYVVVWRVPR